MNIQRVDSQAGATQGSGLLGDPSLSPAWALQLPDTPRTAKKGLNRRFALLCLAANLMVPLYLLCPIPPGGILKHLSPWPTTTFSA
ncbi:MAG: hypothetical protein Q6L60_01160 [Thermostichus sp. HHBFW_bins_43]